MEVKLKDIDDKNWMDCVFLTTNHDGSHTLCEQFVASNALSLLQSKYDEGWITKGIYAGEKLVGFAMYGYDYEENFYEICRLMIDRRYQGKGYGPKSLGIIIEEMKKIDGCQDIYISFEPENSRAQKIYESFGFEDTGRVIDGELLYCLNF